MEKELEERVRNLEKYVEKLQDVIITLIKKELKWLKQKGIQII